MKKITRFIFLLSLMVGMQQVAAQVTLQDFETGGLTGTFGSAAAELAPNPSGSGQVAKLSSNPGGTVWQGTNISLTQNVRLTTDKTMSMDVYSTTPITIAPKVIGGLAGAPDSTTRVAHTGSGWETLTFTFNLALDGSSVANGDYSAFVIYYNWNTVANTFGTPDSRVFYVDNIKGIGVAPPVEPAPTVAAPTPPNRPAADVISLFSDAYTNIGVTEWSTSWDEAAIADVTVAGNATKKITYGNFLGVQLAAYTNATSMTHFHMDYYINVGTDLTGKVLNPKLSNHAAMAGETNALLLTNLPTVAGEWVSLDVPLSSFMAQGAGVPYSREAIYQFLIQSNIGIVYVDNIYLHKNTLGTDKFETSSVKMYPNPVKNTLTIEANSEIQRVSVYNILGQEVLKASPKSNTATLQTNELQKGVYLVTTEIDGKMSTSKVVKE